MGHLVDLPGVKKKRVEATRATSRTQILRLARQGKYMIASGDDGSISLWRRDDGELQARFYRFKATVSEVRSRAVTEVKAWLREWWPKIGQ